MAWRHQQMRKQNAEKFEFVKKTLRVLAGRKKIGRLKMSPLEIPTFTYRLRKKITVFKHQFTFLFYIFRSPTGGLNDKLMRLHNLLLSAMLNRTLVLPRLFSDLKNNETIGLQLFDTRKLIEFDGAGCVVTEDEFCISGTTPYQNAWWH